jgi:hypothetical protein
MINRRFMIVPPALPSGGRNEQLEGLSKEFLRLLLETYPADSPHEGSPTVAVPPALLSFGCACSMASPC